MRILRKILFCILLLFSASQAAFTQNLYEGWQLSTKMESLLTEEGFHPKREILSFTGRDKFPYNISLTINADAPVINRNTVIVDILQSDAINHKKEILNLIRASRNSRITIIYLFSAPDANLPDSRYMTLGSELYASTYENQDNSCAITISFSEKNNNSIHIGSYRKVSPLWMSRGIVSSFENTETEFTLEHNLLSLYRLGLIKGDKRLTAYMSSNIPSIGLYLKNGESLKPVKDFLFNFDPDNTIEWDNHYVYINLPLHSQWIGETAFIIMLFIAASVILLLITFFSFIGKNKQINKNKLKNTWFMIPLTIGVSILSLYTGQFFSWCLSSIFNISLVIQLGIKLILSIFFISALFTFQEHQKINVDSFVYGYLLTIISIANIFIFTAVDIMLLFPFLFEYIFIYISRAASKSKYLILSILLILIPFAPYFYTLLTSGETQILQQYTDATFSTNLLMTLVLFPFQIIWLRLLKNITRYQKEHESSHKKLILKVSVLTLSLIGGSLLFFTALSYTSQYFINKNNSLASSFISSETKYLSLNINKEKMKGMTNYSLKLNSSRQSIRTEITLTSEETVPLFDSLYDYKISEEPGKVFLLIPDYPPETMNINFASEAKNNLILSVKSYYREQNNKIVVENADFPLVQADK